MRAMTLEDVDAVFAIEQAVQAYPWTRGNFADALSGGYLCCVDEADGVIRGYAVMMPLPDEAELLNIGVAAGQQRKGLGRAMLREMLDLAREKRYAGYTWKCALPMRPRRRCTAARVSPISACGETITGMPGATRMQSRWRAI